MSAARALATGGLALALAGWLPAGAQPAWRPIEGSWSVSGRRQAVPVEGGGEAAVVEVSGAIVLSAGAGLSRGFQGRVVGYDDGRGLIAGRAVWSDAEGDQVFSRLEGQALATGRRLVGTITGGTGRYAGLEGEYSLVWQYMLPAEEGRLQGRAVKLTGRVRDGGPQP